MLDVDKGTVARVDDASMEPEGNTDSKIAARQLTDVSAVLTAQIITSREKASGGKGRSSLEEPNA